ncbi:putative beta-farnesene synthase [Helianthus annuus]|nr:putative beta-farnesene synthase [Helianthus annuus]KAJ0636143.1 putative beta-farnesene synthase [Helianthus annuus]
MKLRLSITLQVQTATFRRSLYQSATFNIFGSFCRTCQILQKNSLKVAVSTYNLPKSVNNMHEHLITLFSCSNHLLLQKIHNEVLLKFAKSDFNVVQSMHKKELSQICKWWKDLDLKNKLPHVRDRLVEVYFWILGIYFEPRHSRTRMFLLKTCIWLVVLDDTFDNYGTHEELKIFTNAVQRWSISCLDMLPEYMKQIYQQLLNLHQEMEESLEKEGKAYQINYVKEMAKELTRNFLVEAKWLKEEYMPTLEEYMIINHFGKRLNQKYLRSMSL